MHNLGTYLLWSLAACLFHGSLAKDPNQCDSFDLSEWRTQLNRVVQSQQRGNSRVNGIQAKLHSLESQLQSVEASLEGRQLAVQTRLENQLQAALNKLGNQLQAVSKKIDAAKDAAIPWGFEQIGTRYFRVVEEREDWITARRRCRQMGGYLASFQNEEEFNALTAKLKRSNEYWLGINDRDIEGHHESEASHKPAQFVKWDSGGKTLDEEHEVNCVLLAFGEMYDYICSYHRYFICQADNET